TASNICNKSLSGSSISWLKNSSVPKTSAWSLMGNPKAACKPALAAKGALGKLASFTTSGTQTGLPEAQTRPGHPTPDAQVTLREASANSSIWTSCWCQKAAQRSTLAEASFNHNPPASQFKLSATA